MCFQLQAKAYNITVSADDNGTPISPQLNGENLVYDPGNNIVNLTYPQASWNQTNSFAPNYIWDKPTIQEVATSGSFYDLLDRPYDLDFWPEGVINTHLTFVDKFKLDTLENGSYMLNRSNHTGTQTADTITNGTANKVFTDYEKTKLSNIQNGATANSSDATLKARASHTGTQSADTITDGSTNKAYTATEKTKLSGIATGATANDTDANLKARANHTGTQAISTVTGLQTALDGKNPLITASSHTSDAATNAVNNNATNYNLVSGVLGVANGLNSANAAQNDLADKYNDLATKFNALLDQLEAQGLKTP